MPYGSSSWTEPEIPTPVSTASVEKEEIEFKVDIDENLYKRLMKEFADTLYKDVDSIDDKIKTIRFHYTESGDFLFAQHEDYALKIKSNARIHETIGKRKILIRNEKFVNVKTQSYEYGNTLNGSQIMYAVKRGRRLFWLTHKYGLFKSFKAAACLDCLYFSDKVVGYQFEVEYINGDIQKFYNYVDHICNVLNIPNQPGREKHDIISEYFNIKKD